MKKTFLFLTLFISSISFSMAATISDKSCNLDISEITENPEYSYSEKVITQAVSILYRKGYRFKNDTTMNLKFHKSRLRTGSELRLLALTLDDYITYRTQYLIKSVDSIELSSGVLIFPTLGKSYRNFDYKKYKEGPKSSKEQTKKFEVNAHLLALRALPHCRVSK